MSTAIFYSLWNVCLYRTLYRLLVLFHYGHSYLLHSVHCLSIRHTLSYVSSVSLCPKLSPTVLHRLSLSHNLPFLGSVSLCPMLCSRGCRMLASTSQSTVCPLSVSTIPSKICPLSVSNSHCTVLWFCFTMSTAVFYSLSTVCQYYFLTLTRHPITLLQ